MQVLISDSLIDKVLKKLKTTTSHDPFINKKVIWCPHETLENSAKMLGVELLSMPQGLTVVAHGRSGIVLIEALRKSEVLKAHINKIVLIQCPIWGTPLADFLTGHFLVRGMMQLFCVLARVPIEVFEEMSEFNRQVYMILNRNSVLEIINQIPVTTVGTTFEWKSEPQGLINRILFKFNGLIQNQSGPNDGWVPEKSTRISTETHHSITQVTHLGSIRTLKSTNETDLDSMLSVLSEYPKQFLLVRSEERISEEPYHL